ncbi:MAG: F0F1 ATP synthase subunit A [Acidimicrobiia bacterium]
MLAALFPNGITELFQWKAVVGQGEWYAINKTAIMALVSTAICIVLFVIGGRKKALVPAGMQNFAEYCYEGVDKGISREVIGAHDGPKWTPFLSTLFFWIFFINIWSTVPFIQFPATSRFAIPLFLALQTWLIFIAVGFIKQGPLYIIKAIFPPGVPWPLYILVAPIEFVSKFIVRPFSLAVRLFANMVAGHVLLTVFAIMCAELLRHPSGAYQIAFIPLPFFGLVFMTAFEILVAFLQAYIFTVLTAVYVGESMSEEH